MQKWLRCVSKEFWTSCGSHSQLEKTLLEAGKNEKRAQLTEGLCFRERITERSGRWKGKWHKERETELGRWRKGGGKHPGADGP